MRAIVLASTALALSLSACKVDAPQGFGDPVLALATLSPKTCRDKDTGRFAKCQTCPDGTRIAVSDECPIIVTPPPEPDPTPTPAPDPITGEAPIASEFSYLLGIQTAPVPDSASPDVVGAFRFICGGDGQLLRDDPIVYPGQPGKSHLHQFYGNTGANANSTYKSLRTSGKTNCGDPNYPLNRSAYWMPAMLDGKGNAVRPDHVQIYYKRRPKSDPKCSLSSGDPAAEGNCIVLPNGLKFIFGYDMLTAKAPTGSFDFICSKSGMTNSPAFKTFAEAAQYTQCSAGGRFVVRGKAPGCTDGRLDSPNHRDHVAYAIRDPNYGFMHCPSTHPYVIPGFTLLVSYSIGDGDNIGQWLFASDEMHPEIPHGTTFHADFFMAWDPTVHAMWEDNCLDKLLNCASGVLGNGYMLKGASAPSYGWIVPNRLVPLSSI